MRPHHLIHLILIFTLFFSYVNADSTQPSILLVRDAHYLYSNSEISPYYENALNSNGYSYDTYTVSDGSDTGPNLTKLSQYDIIIWFTGNDGRSSFHKTLTKEDEENLKTYLNNGGKLFLSGQDIGFDRGSDPDDTGFYPNKIHAYFCKDDSNDFSLTGITNNPIGDGLLIDIDEGLGNQNNPSGVYFRLGTGIYGFTNTPFRYYYVLGSITCDSGTTLLCGGVCPLNAASNYDSGGPGGYKIVYFAFGFEGISGSDTRKTIMQRIIEYLSPPDVKNTRVSPTLTNSSITLTSTCVDGQHLSYINGSEYFIDQNPSKSVRGTSLSSSDGSFNEQVENVNASVDITSLDDGNHTIYVRCQDKDGHWGKFDSVNFTKDTLAPAAPFITIESDKAYTNKEKPQLNIIDSSSGSNTPDYIRFSCNGSSWTSWISWTLTYPNFNITSGPGCINSDGSKTVYVQGKDEAGNIQTLIRSNSIILDRVNPVITSISPPNNSYLNPETNITINLTDDSSGLDSNLLIFNNGTINQSFTANTSFNPGWSLEGPKTLEVYIFDQAGNYIKRTYNYKVDNIAPQTSDNSTSTWTSEDQYIKLSCEDSYSGCSYLVYCIGNNSCIPSNVVNISTSHTLKVNCSIGEECEKYVRYRSNDSAGNFESIKTSNVIRIDKKNPAVTLNAPLTSYISGETIVNASISDSGSGLDVEGFNITNSTYTNFNPMVFSNGYWIATLDTTKLADGTYNITIYAKDKVQNINNSEKVQVTGDNTPPLTSDNATSTWTNENQTINLSCNDELSGCSNIEYCIGLANCTPNMITDISLGSINIEVGCNQNNSCEKYIRYRSNDSAGNFESIKTSNLIRIDKEAPLVVIFNPKQGQYYSGVIELLTEITDSDSGVLSQANYTIINATDHSIIKSGTLNETSGWDSSWDSTGYSGEVGFNITAEDVLGNIKTKEVNFYIDNQKPSAVIIEPKAAYKNQSFNLNLKAVRPGSVNLTNASYYIKNSSGTIQSNTTTNINAQNFTFTDLINLSDPKWSNGNYTINFSVIDELGQTSNDTSWFYIDTKPPTTSDNIEGIWKPNDIQVKLACSDSDSGCFQTYYCINTSSSPCGSFQQYSSEFLISCAEDSFCNKTVYYYSIDRAGNIENNKTSLSVLIDKSSPTTTDNSSSEWNAENQTIILQATDLGSGINTTIYCIDSTGTCQPNITYITPIVIGCNQNNSCEKYIRYRSRDSAGNLESIKTSNVIRIDKVAPNSTLNPNGYDWTKNNITFTISCNDFGDSGCSKTYYKIINNSQQCSTLSLKAGTSDIVTCPPGQNCIKKVCFFSQDNVGHNESIKESSNFQIDLKAPNIYNLLLNISPDQFYGNRRIYPSEPIKLNLTASDPRNISQVIVTVNSANYSLHRVSGNNSYGTWQTQTIKTSSLGTHTVNYIYARDTLGNTHVLNSSEINLSFIVVNGSLSVLLNNHTSLNAGSTANLSINFIFNITANNPFLQLIIPPNNFSTIITPPRYTNLTKYTCIFGDECNESITRLNSTITSLNFTTKGNDQNLTLTSLIKAGKPINDTSDIWRLAYRGFRFKSPTSIKTPLLNITNITCNVSNCSPDQNQSFSITITVKNVRNSLHTGNISSVMLNLSSTIENISIFVGNLTSNSSIKKTFNLTIEDANTYNFTFMAYDSSNTYNTTRITNIIVKDIERPNITSLDWEEDNIINTNTSEVLIATATDNIGVDSIWATIKKNFTENATFSLDSGSQKKGIWKLTYNNTSNAGIYNITKIYANDTSGNLFSINPANFSPQLTYFEAKVLTLNTTLGNKNPKIGQNQTITLNILNNGSLVTSTTVKILKPRGFNETINLTLSNTTNNTLSYIGTYSNITRSGNYTVKINVTAGANKIETSTFYVPFGNLSIKSSQSNLNIINGSVSNLSWIISSQGGDIINANVTINTSDNSVLNITGFKYTLVNLTYEKYARGRPVYFLLNALKPGEANLTIMVNSSTDNDILRIPVTVIEEDNIPPNITKSVKEFERVNLLESLEINASFTDNTFVREANLEVTYPSSFSQNIRMLPVDTNVFGIEFTNTTEIGKYTYNITIKDSGNNTDSIQGSFNVTSEYEVGINTDYSAYNKGERVNINIESKNINSRPINGFNLTLILDKGGTNKTLVNNSKKDSFSYTIKSSDPPLGDTPATYTLYAEVKKNNNTGTALETFNVSKVLNIQFIVPYELQKFKVGEEIPLRVNITNTKKEVVKSAAALARCIACKNAGGTEFLELNFNSSSDLYYSNSFIAPPVETFTITVYAMDQFKNYQGDPSMPPYIFLSTGTSSESSKSQETGGAGGGGGGGSTLLDIEVLSPEEIIPPTTKKVELKINTSEKAQCEYFNKDFKFGEGFPFNTENGITHTAYVEVEKGKSYSFKVICKSGSKIGKSAIAFTVSREELLNFDVKIPDSVKVIQGENSTVHALLSNTGTIPLKVVLNLIEKGCCSVEFNHETVIKEKSELSVPIKIHAPLNTSLDSYDLVIGFKNSSVVKERSLKLIVSENPTIKTTRELMSKIKGLEKEIEEYRKAGVNVENLEQMLKEFRYHLKKAQTFIKEDDLRNLILHAEKAQEKYAEIKNGLFALRLAKFFRENWWKIVLGFMAFYTLFYIITNLLIPYIVLKQKLNTLNLEEKNLVRSRKRAEHQYFNREINRDTFIHIMVAKQNEILRLRGQIDEAEKELKSLLKEKLSFKTFFKAPILAIYEINKGIKMREMKKKFKKEKDNK